jgi:putative thioredoxin
MMSNTTEKSAWIVDADEATFQQVAVERSRELLVVVDFWAPWCQPCRLLGPELEKLAREYAGKFLLVKVDIDKSPNIAAGFGVQSIPAVYAMRDGQLLDYFVGLRPEEQLRVWIDRLLPTPAEQLTEEARQLEATDPKAAEAKYAEAGRLDPNLAAAKIGLAGLMLGQGRGDDARAILEELEKRGYLEPEAEKLKAQLDLASTSGSPADLDALRAAVAADSKDLAAKLKLAEALAAQATYEEALGQALAVVESGKKEFAEPARKLMVDIFHLLPDDSPLVTDYRRRLSTALH